MNYEQLQNAKALWNEFAMISQLIERMQKERSTLATMQDISEAFRIFAELSPDNFTDLQLNSLLTKQPIQAEIFNGNGKPKKPEIPEQLRRLKGPTCKFYELVTAKWSFGRVHVEGNEPLRKIAFDARCNNILSSIKVLQSRGLASFEQTGGKKKFLSYFQLHPVKETQKKEVGHVPQPSAKSF